MSYFPELSGLSAPRRARVRRPRAAGRGDDTPPFDPSQDSGISNDPFKDGGKEKKPKLPAPPKNTNAAKDAARLLIDALRAIAFLSANARAANAIQWDDSITPATLRADLSERQRQHINEAGAFVAGVIARGMGVADLSRYDPTNDTLKNMILDSMGLVGGGGEVIQAGGTVIRSIGQMYNNARRLAQYCQSKGAQLDQLGQTPRAYLEKIGQAGQLALTKIAAPIIAGSKFAASELTPARRILFMAALSLHQKAQGAYSALTQIFGSPKKEDPYETQAQKNAQALLKKFNAWLHPVRDFEADNQQHMLDVNAANQKFFEQNVHWGESLDGGAQIDTLVPPPIFDQPPKQTTPPQTTPPPLDLNTVAGLAGLFEV